MMRVQPITDNTPRVGAAPGVESFFLRANHPTEPRAIWVRGTQLVPVRGQSVAEAWVIVSGPDGCTASKHTVPLADAIYREGLLEIGDCRFEIGPAGGRIAGRIGGVDWDLAYTAVPHLGAPLCPYPSRRLIDGAFPKSKVLTPVPVARFSGRIGGDVVTDWLGMQGHNWGKQHPVEYAWGQCVFTGADGAPIAMAEGFTGRIAVGPLTLPRLSALIVRRGEREYRFDRVFSPWRQAGEIGRRKWTLRIGSRDGDAVIAMEATTPRTVCLGYHDPQGTLAYCLNSKLARTVLRVNPADGEGFECTSTHGGALEFLVRSPDPELPTPAC